MFFYYNRYKSELSVQQHQKLVNKNNSTEYTFEENFPRSPENNSRSKNQNIFLTNNTKNQVKRFVSSVSSFNVTKNYNQMNTTINNYSLFDPVKFEQDYNKIKAAFVSIYF